MDKRELRRAVSRKIAEMSDKEKAEESAAVAAKIKAFGFRGKKIFAYNALPDELDVSELVGALAEDNEVYLPVVDGERSMSLARYDGSWEKGAFGIQEPTGSRYSAAEVSPEVCLVPLRAFDDDLNRLGRGKGYYDAFFTSCDCLRIGLAFGCQKVEKIPVEPHDVKLDLVVTASETYRK